MGSVHAPSEADVPTAAPVAEASDFALVIYTSGTSGKPKGVLLDHSNLDAMSNGSKRLPDINWATMVSFAIGVFATWLFLYGLTPALQGFASRALGGLDLSWLAGSLTAAGTYALLGGRVYDKYAAYNEGVAPAEGQPSPESPAVARSATTPVTTLEPEP